MKRLFLLLLLFLCAFDSRADYEPTFLPELVIQADLIIYGEITTVYPNYVAVKTIQTIKGQFRSADERVFITKFKSWTCAQRFASYKAHQQLVFFLKQQNNGKYAIIGAGDEGEIPVIANKVYYKQLYSRLDKSPMLFDVYDGKIYGYSYDKEAFISVVYFAMQNMTQLQLIASSHSNRVAADPENQPLLRLLAEVIEKFGVTVTY
jgi:hypothetical protein